MKATLSKTGGVAVVGAEKKNISVAIFGPFLSWRGFYKSPCEPLSDHLEAEGYSIIRSSSRLSKPLRLYEMVMTGLGKKRSIDLGIIEVYSGSAFMWAEAVALSLRITGKPYIAVLHGGELPEFNRKHPWRVSALLRKAARVVSPSLYLLEKFRTIRQDIRFIANPFEVGHYAFYSRKAVEPNLVWLRAFHEIYNPCMAVKALSRLIAMGINAKLAMIGPDKGDGSLEKTKAIAKDLGVTDRVEFVGPISKQNVAEWLRKFDIFLNSTNVDNIPVSVIEAMASGLCVVSTNAGGMPYLIDHMQDGILVAPNDECAMAEAISLVVSNPELSQKLSQGARKKAQTFNLSESIPKWNELIRSII